jgi:predicted nucleic acid-binding protein
LRQRSARPLNAQGVFAPVKGIADTGFLVAFANANDAHHGWATQIAASVTEPLLTCEAVLAETAFHLESASVALAMLNEGLVALAFDCREHLIQLTRLADRYADRKPDLADLCLVRMSELFPKHSVITIDRTDFRVYRRNKREAIPILSPPEC